MTNHRAKFSSAGNPSARARAVSHAPGQVATIRSTRGSFSHRTRRATSAPATRLSAATIPRAVIESPGTFTMRLGPKAFAGMSWPATRHLIAVAGESSQTRCQDRPGIRRRGRSAARGTIPLANDDAAGVGFPGRTLMVRQPQPRPFDKASACAVRDQHFGHRLVSHRRTGVPPRSYRAPSPADSPPYTATCARKDEAWLRAAGRGRRRATPACRRD